MGRSVLSALALKARKEQKRHIEKRRMTGDEMEVREKWERLLDPSQATIKEFKETYKVATKRPSFFSGETMVPFREYPLQAKVRETIERHWASGHGAKVIEGKGRQEGATTDAVMTFWERFLRGGGGTWNLFSYDEDAVKEMFRRFTALRRQTPEFVFTDLLRGGGEWVKTTAKAMELEFRNGDNALLQCLTAGDKHSGSGSSPRGLLWDEFSKWKDEIKADPTAMSEGWADGVGNVWLIPSTGQGQDIFAERFMACWTGEDTVSGFEAVFMPWIGHPDRQRAFVSERELEEFKARVGTQPRWGIEEEKRILAAGGTMSELNWRRMKVAELGFNLTLVGREYPLIPGDMFRDTMRNVFEGFEDVIASHMIPSREREQRGRRGFLETSGSSKWPVFVDDVAGKWVVLEEPDPTKWYVFGADSTSGKQTVNDASGEPDYAVGTIDELETGRTVAYYRDHADGREFGREMFKAACWYRGPLGEGALGYVESNSIGIVTILTMQDEVLGSIHGSDLLLTQIKTPTSNSVSRTEDVGFWKDQASGEVLIDAIRRHLEEVGVYDAAKGTPFTHRFLGEAAVFERNPKTGRAEARKGKDDAVVSKGLSLYARAQVFARELVDVSMKVRRPALDSHAEFLMRQARIEAGLEKVEPAKYWHPRGGRAPRGDEPVEFSDMKGF